MSPAALFATHFARLLSLRVREPNNIDAHRTVLSELIAANDDAVTLTWDNWHLRVGDELIPPTAPDMLDLLSRMAAHGVREISFAAKTERAHLLGAVWSFGQEPVFADGGGKAMSRLAILNSTSLGMVPVVGPPAVVKQAPAAV